MAHLIPYKATAKERCNRHGMKSSVRQKSCYLCGKTATVGAYCQECSDYLKRQRREKKKDDH